MKIKFSFFKLLVISAIVAFTISIPAFSQVAPSRLYRFGYPVVQNSSSNPLCYQQTPRGQMIDLSELCGVKPQQACDPSYPAELCIPPKSVVGDLNCPYVKDGVEYRNFRVVGDDPHKFDGDKDGFGCDEP